MSCDALAVWVPAKDGSQSWMLRGVGIFLWVADERSGHLGKLPECRPSVCLGKGVWFFYTAPNLSPSRFRHSQATTWSLGCQHRVS